MPVRVATLHRIVARLPSCDAINDLVMLCRRWWIDAAPPSLSACPWPSLGARQSTSSHSGAALIETAIVRDLKAPSSSRHRCLYIVNRPHFFSSRAFPLCISRYILFRCLPSAFAVSSLPCGTGAAVSCVCVSLFLSLPWVVSDRHRHRGDTHTQRPHTHIAGTHSHGKCSMYQSF